MVEESKPTGRSTRGATGEARPVAKSAAGTAAAKTTAKAKGKPVVDAVAPSKAPAKSPAKAAVKAKAAGATEVSQVERARMIETAAYFRAERRGFEPGYELEDWAVAEAEVDELLGLDAPKTVSAARKKTPKSEG